MWRVFFKPGSFSALSTENKLPRNINPILHTAWLDNHALTLKSNAAKYYFGENQIFAYFPKSLL
jgi:hypothetical protein